MNGIKINELYELISQFHEIEFEYDKTNYVLQTEVNAGRSYLVIWDCTYDAEKCIAKHEIGVSDNIPKSVINTVLSEKCFCGKSFLEIEKYITVTVIQ